MNETNSRRGFLRHLTGTVVRIGSGGWIAAVTVAAPAEAATVLQAASAVDPAGTSRTNTGVTAELLADMNDLAGILEQ